MIKFQSSPFFFFGGRTLAVVAMFLPLLAHAQMQDLDARARQIVSQMTLDEKISQLHGTKNDVQYRIVVGVPRLGIPDLLVTNGPAGFGPAGPGHQGKATALPAPISLAATWDVEASKEYGVIAGSESVDFGNTLLESPDINIARIPQNGRTFEAYGEDPFLVARLSVAHILGVQSQGIIANVKHYAANNQEASRFSVDAEVDERTLREIYLPAFEASIKEAKCASIMGAYNRLNGSHCCENDVLLNQILKKEWGFDGFVTSDFGAVHSTASTVLSGLDLEMPTGAWLGDRLKAEVEAGKVPVAVIDEHLVRRFRTMMKWGVWDHLPVQKPIPEKENGEKARRLAEEGMVLLRNESNLLPLHAESLKTVALFGFNQAENASTGGGGSSRVAPVYQISPLVGLQNRLGTGVVVTLHHGQDLAEAVDAAKAADVAIVMVGDRQAEGKDHSISLDDVQDALVTAVAGANPRTIVVVKSGGPVLMPWVKSVPAIVEAWYPGEEDGNAVAAVLMGDYNPSGKLPITFPSALADVPANTPERYPGTGPDKHTVEKYSEGVLVGYRWYDAMKIAPLFPFGYGLSYTSFDYKNPTLSAKELPVANPALTVEFDVANTGKRAGAEVAQVYLGLPSLPGVEQPRQLKGFARVNVEPGQATHVRVALDARAFSYWDVATHGWKVAPGEYPVYIGASSRDIRLNAKVTVR